MELSLVITLVLGIAVVAVGVYQVVTGRATPQTFDDALDLFHNVTRLVETFAPAADQLVKIGQLQPEQRRAYVIDMVLDYLDDVDPQLIVAVIEAWVADQKRDV